MPKNVTCSYNPVKLQKSEKRMVGRTDELTFLENDFIR